MPDDGPIVDEQHVGDPAQSFERFEFIGADRLIAQIAAGGDNGETEFRHEQMMERI